MATTIYDHAMAMLVDSYRAALNEAYDNRHGMRWVSLDSATHDVLAEAAQRLREERWRDSLAAAADPDSESNPALLRSPDGTAPPLLMIYGLPVRIDDTVESSIEWDVGEPLDPMILNLFTSPFISPPARAIRAEITENRR
jgi:hypothetical protein